MPDRFTDLVRTELDRLGVAANERQLHNLAAHFDLLVDENQRVNLTRITDPAQAAVRLYADSAAVLAWHTRSGIPIRSVLDVGTGAGFPAVPLAVLAPDWQVTAVDGTAKKVRLVESAARLLGLANLQAVHAHTDHWQPHQTFDLVTFKAVGSLANCVPLAHRFLNTGGIIAIYKTASVGPGEFRDGQGAAAKADLQALPPFEYTLTAPDGPAELVLHLFRKQ